MAVGQLFGDIASMKPAVLNRLTGCFLIPPITREHSRSAHEDFPVRAKLHVLWKQRHAGIAWFLKWNALAKHQCMLRDPVKIAQIDAPNLPDGLDCRRNRRTGGKRSAQSVQPDLHQHRPEHQLSRQPVASRKPSWR